MGISLPIKILAEIDEKRGDVSRSRFISRILEKNTQTQTENKVLDE